MWVSPHHSEAVVPLSVEVTCFLTAPSINVRVVARGAQLKGKPKLDQGRNTYGTSGHGTRDAIDTTPTRVVVQVVKPDEILTFILELATRKRAKLIIMNSSPKSMTKLLNFSLNDATPSNAELAMAIPPGSVSQVFTSLPRIPQRERGASTSDVASRAKAQEKQGNAEWQG
ncbi:hypothetical protein BGW80DRAFT_1248422 [Lactifluus volemus]|nr:hypothetical protein BGW80DRAFT_1248422 [Lactifluus volemus]